MASLYIIHNGLANTSWMFFLIVGLWGGFRAMRGQGMDGSYLGALALGQGIFVLQAVLGILMLINNGMGDMLRPSIHILYGVFSIIFIPFIYFSVLKGDDSNRGQWVMTFCTLFIFGISLRTIELGREIASTAVSLW